MAMQQRIVVFSGHVQGVGFRYTAVQTARGYDVTGTVRNRPDGRVEAVIEGEADEIDRFLAELSAAMGHLIRDRSDQTAPHTGRYDGFRVKY